MASIDYPLDRPRTGQTEFSFSETLYQWVATVDHKRLGLMYIVTALLFLVIAGLIASVIRLQLAFS
jgi:cytochrome c oxidase subunit 1